MHWYARYKISNALDGGDLPAVLARGHALRCAACQGFAARLQAQHTQLARGAQTAPAPRPDGRRRARRVLVFGAPLALGAALALALLVPAAHHPLALPLALPLARVPVASDGGAAPPPTALVPATLAVRGVTDRVSELFASASDPLDAELGNLVSDGRHGLDTILATGGLPRMFDDSGASRD